MNIWELRRPAEGPFELVEGLHSTEGSLEPGSLLQSLAYVVNAVCGLALSCHCKAFPKSKVALLRAYLALKFYIPFSIDGAFPDVKVARPLGTNPTPYH